MRNLGQVRGKIQALLGDPRGQWVTRAYINPLIDLSYAAINLNLKNASGKELEAVITVPDVPAGTTSLYPWQAGTAVPGAPANQNATPALLAGLFDPIEVWVKPAGQPVWTYSQARERDDLPHVNPLTTASNSLAPGVFYNWLGNRLGITPVNQPLDIEVTGKFNPPPLADDTDLLVTHEDVWIAVAYITAATAGVERSNPQILAGYAESGIAAQDNIVAAIMRQGQGTPRRFQRVSRESGLNQWFWS